LEAYDEERGGSGKKKREGERLDILGKRGTPGRGGRPFSIN